MADKIEIWIWKTKNIRRNMAIISMKSAASYQNSENDSYQKMKMKWKSKPKRKKMSNIYRKEANHENMRREKVISMKNRNQAMTEARSGKKIKSGEGIMKIKPWKQKWKMREISEEEENEAKEENEIISIWKEKRKRKMKIINQSKWRSI